jgi:hypothetical protein
MSERFPRLSETNPKHPLICQECKQQSLPGETTELIIWQECDDRDKPEQIYIVLCVRCSNRIIKPHPRLYRQTDKWGPVPGAMACCASCRLRAGGTLICSSKLLKRFGGPGLPIRVTPGVRGFIDGKNYRGPFVTYSQPPTCDGFEPIV